MEDNAEGIKKGRGRPKKDDSCRNAITLRLDSDDEARLTHIIVEDGGNKSDVLRKALRLYYNVRSSRW